MTDNVAAPKGAATRMHILETALRLFEERGYAKTTMRAIAQEAGVSVGNAYYYFASKEHLIQGFYDRIIADHQHVAQAALAAEPDMAARLGLVMRTWLDVATPYREFGAQLFITAADPDSPLSPFSEESAAARELAISICAEAVNGATTRVDPKLRDVLPELAWLAEMGLVLYWVHDRSPGCLDSYRLVDRLVPFVRRTLALSRIPVLRSAIREAADIAHEFGLRRAAADPSVHAGPHDKDVG
ncbi:TetR/AcrR family transcriptional regulator [Nocardia sp. NPDC057030]|uniref:TetR/AcrR family transcriptional regulator n=1 Tax=unclassified Nocardia TaxID=2637762 RepID=UPI0036252680